MLYEMPNGDAITPYNIQEISYHPSYESSYGEKKTYPASLVIKTERDTGLFFALSYGKHYEFESNEAAIACRKELIKLHKEAHREELAKFMEEASKRFKKEPQDAVDRS